MLTRRNALFGGAACLTMPVFATIEHAVAQSRSGSLRIIALVIGMQSYHKNSGLVPLRAPLNDAKTVASKLSSMGADVITVLDEGTQKLHAEIARFADKLRNADLAVVYYSGHSIQVVLERNVTEQFFAPVDVNIPPETPGKPIEAVQLIGLSMVKNTIRSMGKFGIVLWDACRDNPYYTAPLAASRQPITTTQVDDRLVRSGKQGQILAGDYKSNASKAKILVHYSTGAGSVAEDDSAQGSSPYAKHLVQHIDRRGTTIQEILSGVTDGVKKTTDGRQSPVFEGDIDLLKLTLVAAAPSAIKAAPPAQPTPQNQPKQRPAPSVAAGGGQLPCEKQGGCQTKATLPNGRQIMIETKGFQGME